MPSEEPVRRHLSESRIAMPSRRKRRVASGWLAVPDEGTTGWRRAVCSSCLHVVVVFVVALSLDDDDDAGAPIIVVSFDDVVLLAKACAQLGENDIDVLRTKMMISGEKQAWM